MVKHDSLFIRQWSIAVCQVTFRTLPLPETTAQ